MLTPRSHLQDCQGPVHARFSKRRERRPGLRERHSASQAIKTEDENRLVETTRSTPRSTFAAHSHSGGISEHYTLRTAPKHALQETRAVNQNDDDVLVSTHYKELTTIEAIRKQLASLPRPQTAPPTLPDWLLNLDLNLDVTAVDVIPPFDSSTQNSGDTHKSRPKVTIVHEENYNSDIADTERYADNGHFRYDDPQEQKCEERHTDREERRTGSRLSNISALDSTSKGPRQYQGDMRVMSMQMGGVRSTPFQPKAKKFINQMITYQHMKVHNKKLKNAKPAVDARMPSTFHIALERKKLVEERLTESWNASYHSSTPRKTPTPTSSKVSLKDKQRHSSSTSS